MERENVLQQNLSKTMQNSFVEDQKLYTGRVRKKHPLFLLQGK